ncbi:MAG: primosomal protein N' [Candidatus Berkelbacteria bacterium]
MQIAQIVPKVKTRGSGIFDYSIPPELLVQIKIGLLVKVPFHGRKVEGIILTIKKSSKFDNLKPILKIIDTVPVVDEIHIELARWMSEYYLTDFTKTLFENIVPPAKRTIKKQTDIIEPEKSIINETKKPGKKFLVVADFKARLMFYQKIISKVLSQNKQIIILIPDLDLVPFFTKNIKEEISVISSGMTLTKRWKIWDSIRCGQTRIVIGSNSAIFAPTKNLGLVIIDQEENETYKNDQSPRFNITKVAHELTKLTNANLVIGSISPSLETYHTAKQNKYLYKIKPDQPANISIVNMTFERGILSQPLKDSIEQAIELNQKIMIVLNRKGEGARLFCPDCKWIQTCPICKNPLKPGTNTSKCTNCNKDYSAPAICPICHSSNLKNIGMTTTKLEKIIRENWPSIKITRIEKDHIDTSKDWQIAIVTSFALKTDFPEIETVVLLDADFGLNFAGYRTEERNFQTYLKFLRLAKNGLIQTHLPESQLVKNLASLNYENFYETEITNRQKFNYPPFTKLTRIIYRNPDKMICSKEAENVTSTLSKIILDNHLDIKLLGPLASTSIKHGFFYQQVILKQNKRSVLVDNYLRTLPKGWIIDVDPFDINL